MLLLYHSDLVVGVSVQSISFQSCYNCCTWFLQYVVTMLFHVLAYCDGHFTVGLNHTYVFQTLILVIFVFNMLMLHNVAALPIVSNVHVKEVTTSTYSGEGEYFGGYEGSSLFSWYRETIDGTTILIDGANTRVYEVTDADYNCRLLFG